MTYILELNEETVRFLEEQAQLRNLSPEKVAVELIESEAKARQNRRERLMQMAEELFDERASAYEALAEGAK